MFRATRTRGELPTRRRDEQVANLGSLESLLALVLCTIVVLACMAFLRSSSTIAQSLAGMQSELRVSSGHGRTPGAGRRSLAAPSLVLVLALDGLRPNRMECFGYSRPTTPSLDRFAQECCIFRTVAAQASQPLISRASILSAKYPATLMLEETGADLFDLARIPDPREYLQATFERVNADLVASFGSHGVRTAAFASTSEGTLAGGFETLDTLGGGGAAVLERARAWIDAGEGTPSFAWVQLAELDWPYAAGGEDPHAFCTDRGHAPPSGHTAALAAELTPEERTVLSDHYDASLRALDARVGTFLEELRTSALYARALVVVTAAHGEDLGEGPRFGHGGLSLGEVLVPLFLKLPDDWDVLPHEVQQPAELVDLLPTLLASSGIAPAEDLDGHSLLPTILRGVGGRERLLAQTVFEEGPAPRFRPAECTLLRPGRWQVIRDPLDDRAQFFDLAHDPLGSAPLEVSSREFEPLLSTLLEDSASAPHATLREDEPAQLGEQLERVLAGLGYDAAAVAGPGGGPDLR